MIFVAAIYALFSRFFDSVIPTQHIKYIRARYGDDLFMTFRKLEKTSLKLQKNKCDLEFLRICAIYKLTPSFIRINLWKKQHKNRKKFNNSAKEIKLLMNSLEKCFGIIDLKQTQQYLHERTKKKLEETVKIHEKKLKELNEEPVGQNYLAMRTKVVHNLSTYQLSEGEERVLARGWEFCIERKLTNSTDLKTELEVNAKKL